MVALVIIVAAYGPWFQLGEGEGPGDGSGDAGSAGVRSAGVRSADVRSADDGSAARPSVTGATTGAPQPHEPGGRPGGRKGVRPPAALSLRVRVPDRDVDVALDVAPGEVVAVLGPNGAGKSTLLQAIAGLGDLGGDITVTLGDRVVAEPGIRPTPPRDRRVGWLGQRALLLRHASVGDNVAFGPLSRGTRRGEARALAHTLLSDVGAAHLAARRPHELSGGQAQRIAIARALATDPDVLLVDEPFSALDVGAAQHARLLLQAAHRSAPRTTLLVTHDLLDVAQLADRVVVIEDGRVVEDGPAAEVLTRPRSTFGGRFAGVNLLVGRVVLAATGEGRVAAVGTAEAGTAGASGAVLATPLGEVHGTTEDPLEADTEAVALFEPRAVSVHRDPPGGSPRNAFSVVLTGIEPHGSLLRVWADAGQDQREVAGNTARSDRGTDASDGGIAVRVAADLTPAAVAELGLLPGERLWFVVKAAEVTVLPR
nr:ATP-binding cassette domain-containing protein [Promicromonospora panici]